MQRNEVKVWINYHGEIFPEWGTWYMKPGKAARAMMFEAIIKALYKIDLEDAKNASDAMLAGDPQKPFREEDHLAAIIRKARAIKADRQPRRHFVDGEQTVKCPRCLDTGYVTCWRRDLVQKMSVICSCAFGDAPAASLFGRDVQRFDDRYCYRVGDTSDHWARIRAQVEADQAAGTFETLKQYQERTRLA